MTEAKHFDDGKPGIQFVLGMSGLAEVARVGDFGAKKYGQWNYKCGMPWMKLAGSCSRHLTAWIIGETYDKESGLHHLAHMVYDGLMLLDYAARNKGQDDRYIELPKSDSNTLAF